MLYLHDPITERIINISDKSKPKYELYSYSRFNGQEFYAPISIPLSELINSITDPKLIPKIENMKGIDYSKYLELRQVIPTSENSSNKTKSFDIVLGLKDKDVNIMDELALNIHIFNKTTTIKICTISLLTKEEKDSLYKNYDWYKSHKISTKDMKTIIGEDIIAKLSKSKWNNYSNLV